MLNEAIKKYYDACKEVMSEEPVLPEEERLQSVIGMICTLLEEGKATELDEIINFHFPSYYLTNLKLFHSTN